jgi:CRP/FNR family transcriptional regulator, anaerobic regulatory protein
MSSDVGPIAFDRCQGLRCSSCRELDAPLKHELARISRIRKFRAGETIIGELDEIDFVGHVVAGVLRLEKMLLDGRQQIVGLLFPGNMFGRPFARSSAVSIEAASDVTLCCRDKASFESLVSRYPELEHRMLLGLMRELDMSQEWLLLLGRQTVLERVAAFLVILWNGGKASAPMSRVKPRVTVPISRKDVAAYLGTTVETISRSVQELARGRVIRIINPQDFEILDPDRLLHLSGKEAAEALPDLMLEARSA